MKAIEVLNVSKYFFVDGFLQPKMRVLEDLTFDIESGQNVAIIGPNGCGKTTLLKTIATIYMPDEGSIKVFGNDIKDNIERARNAFSFVSPALNFQAKLTLRQTMKFFGRVLDKRPDYIMPFLKRMGIDNMMDSRLEGFSEGQKAMVRLAIGFIKNPRILMLDEVVANLDMERKERVINFILEEDELKDLTILMVDHDPHVVDRLCDKIIILDKGGKMYKMVSVPELLNAIEYRFNITVTLKKDMSDQEIEKISSLYTRYGPKIRYFAHNEAEVVSITQSILEKSDRVLELATNEVSLKDVYFLMMEGELGKF
jgi:ABC-type multidrug transport system ATPase subunit